MTFKCQKHVAKSQFDELNWNSKSYRSIIIDNWIFKSADRSGPCWLDAAGRRLIHSLERWLTTWSGRVSFLWFHISHFIFHKFFFEMEKKGRSRHEKYSNLCHQRRWNEICGRKLSRRLRFLASLWPLTFLFLPVWGRYQKSFKNPSKIPQKSLNIPKYP